MNCESGYKDVTIGIDLIIGIIVRAIDHIYIYIVLVNRHRYIYPAAACTFKAQCCMQAHADSGMACMSQ